MARGLFAAPVLACLLAAGLPALSDDTDGRPRKARIVDLEVARDGDRLRVAFRLENGFSDELAENLAAGIPVRFRHRVEVTTRHWMPLWPSRVMASATVETTVTYDSLTHRYELTRVIEASSRKKSKSPPRTDHGSTVLESEARAWMTELNVIPPLDLSALPEGETARVHVESALGRKWIVLVPTRRVVSADHKLGP